MIFVAHSEQMEPYPPSSNISAQIGKVLRRSKK